MSDDIQFTPQRLRDWSYDDRCIGSVDQDLRWAASEIERLRTALEKIATHHHPQTRGCAFDAQFARSALGEKP